MKTPSEWKYFTRDEMTCQCGCGHCNMDEEFMRRLDKLRERCGFPFRIASGFRCDDHNAEVSTTGEGGPHTTGKAVDIMANASQRFSIIEKGLFPDIGITGIGPAKTFIHLDTLTPEERPSRPCVWSY